MDAGKDFENFMMNSNVNKVLEKYHKFLDGRI